MTLDKARDVKMELITKSGKTIVLKPKVSLLDGEVIDSMFMSKKALLDFYEQQIEDAHKTGVMFSLHVKATMMKVSHPIVFGHCVRIFYKEAFEKHAKLFEELGVNVNNGMVDLYNKIATLPRVAARGDHARPARLPREPPRAGHGRFRQGHHQLPFAQRRDRRRLHAGDDPQRRQDVRRRRPAEGSEGGDAREHLRPHLPGDHQLLQMARRLRPEDHGHRAQRRPDGAAGRGIRLARQDLRDPRGRRRQHHRPRHRRGAAEPERGGRATSGACARSRTRRSATGSSSPSRARATPACRRCSGSTRTARTRRADQEGQDLPEGPRHRRAWTSRS